MSRRPADEQLWLRTASLMILAAVAVTVALIYTRPVMIPFVLALFLSYLAAPLVDFMQVRLRVPRVVSVLCALLVVAGLMTLLALMITYSTSGLVESADIYREKITSFAQVGFSVLDRFDIELGQEVIVDGLRQLPLLNMARRTAGTVVDFVTQGFLVLIFVIFLLVGRTPNQMRHGLSAEIDAKIRRYIVTKVATSAATGILVGIILALFGLELALVFGVLAFFLNFIPNIGPIVATLLPLPIAIVQFDSLWMILGILLVPGLVQMVIGNGVEPSLIGEGLDLHPVTILFALVFWGLIWGIVGMFLAAPMTAVLRIVMARFGMTRTLAELMAGRLPEPEKGDPA
jgi:AI-2 transport protein TqsA